MMSWTGSERGNSSVWFRRCCCTNPRDTEFQQCHGAVDSCTMSFDFSLFTRVDWSCQQHWALQDDALKSQCQQSVRSWISRPQVWFSRPWGDVPWMLGQFDFGQSWPRSKLAEVEQMVFALFSSFFTFLSIFFFFFFLFLVCSFSSSFLFIFFSFFFCFCHPKTFALNPKQKIPKPQPTLRWTLIFGQWTSL